jgi:hypothetical protein
MSIDHEPVTTVESLPQATSRCGNSVTVYMKDTLGAIFLGFLSAVLLIGWMRAEARYRTLLVQLEATHGNRSIDSK